MCGECPLVSLWHPSACSVGLEVVGEIRIARKENGRLLQDEMAPGGFMSAIGGSKAITRRGVVDRAPGLDLCICCSHSENPAP